MNAMEQLETRLLLTADVWTGASSNLWSDNGNWQDGTAPTTGADLIFPASATNMTSVYDSGLGVSDFGSIDIQSSGYDISTSFSSSLVLTSGLSATYGSSISNFDISFAPGNGMVAVGAGATLEVGGVISGSSGLEVSGGGTLQTAGTSSNSYSGTTTVDAGTTLVLDKSSATAVPGNLTVNATGTVQLAQSDQISDSTNVVMLAGATLDLNNFDDAIGGLNLTGSTVSTGTGTITLGGDVTSNSDAATSVISGNMDLGGATRTFTVGNNPQLDPDLSITANISGIGAGIISAGPNSQLRLSGNNTYDGTTTITAGAIEIASDNALGASSAGTVVNSGFSLALLGSITVPEPITINGVGFGGLGAIFNGNGNNTITGNITLAAASTIGSLVGNLTFGGAISDGASSFALTKVCAGTVTLTHANTYDGGTTITNGLNGSGVLAITNGSALGTGSVSISNGSELDLSNDITLSRDISFRGAGANSNGALRSVSGNNTYSGTATLQATGTWINVDAGQLTLSGDLTDNSNGFTTEKYGSGLLLVTGNLTSVGQLHAVEGEVRIDGSYTGAVILAGGNISGTGTPGSIDHFDGDLGAVDPGTGAGTVGTLTTTNGYAVRTNATTHIDIGGTTAGSTYDQIIAVPGGVILTGSNIEVSLVGGFVPAIGDVFTIIDDQAGDTITGTFNGLNEGATFQSGIATYQVSYTGGTGNDVTLTVVAVTNTWTGLGADSLWSTAANWDTNVAPIDGEDLIFPQGAARLSNVNDLSGQSFHSIEIHGSGYFINGNPITLTNGISAAYTSGTSEFNINTTMTASETFDIADGGTLDFSGVITVNNFGGGYGVTKTGGGTLRYSGSSANLYNGGTVINAGTLVLAKSDDVISSNGSVIVGDNTNGATLQVEGTNQFWVGADVTVNEGSTFDVGSYSQFISNLNLQGSTVQIDDAGILSTFVGVNTYSTSNNIMSAIQGLGALKIDNSSNTFTIADDAELGVELSISANIQGQFLNSGLNMNGPGTVAISGNNTFGGDVTVNSGAIQVEGNNALGKTAGATTVASGASVYFSGSGLSVAENFNIEGAGLTASGALGVLSGSNTLTGSVDMTNNSQIGAVYGATLTIDGVIDDGASTYNLTIINGSTGRTVLGGSNLFDGDMVVSSGFVRGTNDNSFGDAASSTSLNVQSGATLELVGGITIPGTKTIEISGLPVANSSKIQSVAGDNAIAGDIGITGGNNVAFDVASGTTLTSYGAISGSRDFDKNNSGTLILSGTNTNTGNVNVGDGTLLVNGSLATSNSVFVDGTLGGSGTVSSVTLSNIGTLSPGNSPGIMNTGDLTFQSSGSTFSVEINGTSVGTQYDQTNVTGTVSLAGATLSISLGYSPTGGDTFIIIDNDGSDAVSGTFNGLAEGASVSIGGRQFLMTYAGGDGNDVALSVLGIPTVLGPSTTTTTQRPTITWTAVPGAAQYIVLVRNDSTGGTSLLITQAGTSYTPTKDLGIGSYRVYVRAVTASGVSSQYSTSSSFRITTAVVLNVPTKFQTTTTPTISWTPVGGAVKYDLWINNLSTGVPQVVRDVNVTGSSWTSQTSLPMGSYRAWVRGIDASGLVANWSTAVEFFLLPAVSVVSPVTPTFDRTPTFTWDAVPGAVSYVLYYQNYTTGTAPTSIPNTSGNSYTPSSNLVDGNYRWYVLAVTQGNYRSQSATMQYSYVGGRPSVLTPTGSTSDTTPIFNWTPVSGAATYKLFVSRTDVPTSGIISQVGLTTAYFTPTTPLPVGVYRVWVQAVSSTGSFSLWSDPVNFSVTSIGDESPALPRELLLSDLTILSDGDLQLVANPSRSKATEDAVPKEEASTTVEAMASISLDSKSELHDRLLLESQGILNENTLKSSATGTVADDELLDAVMANVNSLYFLMERVG